MKISNLKLFILLALGLVIVNGLFLKKTAVIEKGLSFFCYPVLCVSSAVAKPFKVLLIKIKTLSHLSDLCQRLEIEREELLEENLRLNAIKHHFEKIEDLLAFKEKYKMVGSIAAKILLTSLTESEHYVIVNKGSLHGIKKDMVAIYKFQLIGRVCDIKPLYSKVLLITDCNSKVSSYTNTSNANGISEGTNIENKCILKYASHIIPVLKQDLVISSGKGMVFPEGFCIGKIINSEKKNVCHEVEIETLMDFKNLETCMLTNIERIEVF
jgi:rod shape-determining protein MreC